MGVDRGVSGYPGHNHWVDWFKCVVHHNGSHVLSVLLDQAAWDVGNAVVQHGQARPVALT